MWQLMPVLPATQEAEIRRMKVLGQPRQKVSKHPISIKNLGIVVHTYYTSYAGSVGRRMQSRPAQAKRMRSYPKK
jgi:hypothetical protein